MKNETLLKIVALTSIILITSGIYFKILHYDFAYTLLIAGAILTLILVLVAAFELIGSKKITTKEKCIWIILIVAFNSVASIVYFFYERRKIVGDQ